MKVDLTKSEVEKGSELTDLQGRFDWEKFLNKHWGKILPVFLGLLLVGVGLVLTKASRQQEAGIEILPAQSAGGEADSAEDSAEQNLEEKSIFVDIAGAVINPGVYELPKESRINDLLAAAGGLSSEADREWVEANLNRAQELADGAKVYIPSRGEAKSEITIKSGVVAGEQKYFGVIEPETGLVNINTASQGDLDSLPGIGPTYAQRIIDYRESHGDFKSVGEIKNVSGIGPKTFEKIKDKITI